MFASFNIEVLTMFNEDSFIYKNIASRGVEPTSKNIHDIWVSFSPELRNLINKWGENDSTVREMIDEELNHLI